MMKTHLLVAVMLSALTACGGDENEDSGNEVPAPSEQTDNRKNVTGSYAVTGTLTLTANGKSDVSQVQDTLRITNDTTSASKAALLLHIASLGCGPKATMTGERTFNPSNTKCPMPPQQDCTASLTYTRGIGKKEEGGALQTSLYGKIDLNCGSRGSATVDVSMVMSGSRTGESLPDMPGDALKGTTSVTLSEALEQVALTTRQ
ncbi:hypothetical protein JY651_38390 [Pyxidicoccus parkwayensis]|uniref:Lipoprotein n=1 Tax=Pyxidicoccus parkwayensis TaxID=2813578 RepID=A0ABX7NRQ0_9BACT|nr:hypothetical protein [Pyxidicoccus parkwaysis]QSQ21024.1 hypothetical protein JY651_38390 [Pyxidicoccus parkwaysis]